MNHQPQTEFQTEAEAVTSPAIIRSGIHETLLHPPFVEYNESELLRPETQTVRTALDESIASLLEDPSNPYPPSINQIAIYAFRGESVRPYVVEISRRINEYCTNQRSISVDDIEALTYISDVVRILQLYTPQGAGTQSVDATSAIIAKDQSNYLHDALFERQHPHTFAQIESLRTLPIIPDQRYNSAKLLPTMAPHVEQILDDNENISIQQVHPSVKSSISMLRKALRSGALREQVVAISQSNPELTEIYHQIATLDEQEELSSQDYLVMEQLLFTTIETTLANEDSMQADELRASISAAFTKQEDQIRCRVYAGTGSRFDDMAHALEEDATVTFGSAYARGSGEVYVTSQMWETVPESPASRVADLVQNRREIALNRYRLDYTPNQLPFYALRSKREISIDGAKSQLQIQVLPTPLREVIELHNFMYHGGGDTKYGRSLVSDGSSLMNSFINARNADIYPALELWSRH